MVGFAGTYLPQKVGYHMEIPAVELIVQAASTEDANESRGEEDEEGLVAGKWLIAPLKLPSS